MAANIYATKHDLKPETVKPVMDIINHSPLQKIIQKAKFLMELDDIIYKSLPKEYAATCQVLNYKSDRVIIGVKNAAIATKLRYESATILEKIKSGSKLLKCIKGVDFKVKPSEQ